MNNNRWLQLCIDMMRMQIHYKWGDTESMQLFDILSPHAFSIVEYACSNCSSDFSHLDSLPVICNVLGFGYRYNGKYTLSMDCYKKAMSYYKRALYIFESTLGKNSPDVAVVCSHIAAVYAEKHSYDMSLRWHQRDIKISETVLGAEHPDTATAYHNLGVTYYQMGNCKRALIWLKKAIIVKYKILGKDHYSFGQSIRSALLAYVSICGSALSFADWLRDTCGIDQSVIFSIIESEPCTIGSNAFRQDSHDQ